ncbi:MAG TPA: hypothetical protein VNY35_08930 [Solirubrobacteraceae bacterium]|nr:hypothetical protein [Solirubrobacteraceae bacterium]
MTSNPLAMLAAANPVPELPAVAPIEGLTCLTESPPAPLPRHSKRSGRIALAAAAAVGLGAVAAGLTLSGGSSDPSVGVAAAAYAATSPGSGVIEAEFVIRRSLPGLAQAPIRHREWLEATTGRRREQTLSRDGSVESELLASPGRAEIWEPRPPAAGMILRFRNQAPASEPVKPDGLELYRRLYEGGSVRIVGRETLDGRTLWKLEGNIGYARRRLVGRLRPVFGEVVLVDPTTYLPVVERQVDLTRPGYPTMLETRLVHYRRLPRRPSSDASLPLSTEHRGARVLGGNVLGLAYQTPHKLSPLLAEYLHTERVFLERGARAVERGR